MNKHAPPDQDELDARAFAGRLLAALHGRNVDTGFLAETVAGAAKIEGLADQKKVKGRDLKHVREATLGEPPDVFGDKKMKGKENAKKRAAAIKDFLRQIEAEMAFAHEDRDAGRLERLPAQRLVYLDAAKRMFAEEEPQLGFQMLESARLLRMRAGVVDARDALLDARDLDAEDDSGLLDHVVRALEARAADLKLRAGGLDDFAAMQMKLAKGTKHESIGKKANIALSDMKLELFSATAALDGLDGLADTEENRATLARHETRLAEAERMLAGIEAPLRKWMSAMTDVGIGMAKTYVKTDKNKVERTGGELDGGGDARARSKAEGVPQERLNVLSVGMQVHELYTRAGVMDEDHFEVLHAIARDVKREVDHLDAHIKDYERAAKFAKIAKKQLSATACAYKSAERDRLLGEVERFEEMIKTDVRSAHIGLDRMTMSIMNDEPGFREAEKDFADLKSRYDKAKTLLTGDYATLLSDVVKSAEKAGMLDAGDHLDQGRMNFLRRRRSYKGEHHDSIEAIWSGADHGSEAERNRTRAEIGDLVKLVTSEIDTLKGLRDAIKARKKTRAPYDVDALDKLAEDLKASETELAARKDLEKAFRKEYDRAMSEIDQYAFRLAAFWKWFGPNDRRMDPGTKDALASHRTFLKVLDTRTKTTRTSAEWQQLVADCEKVHRQIERFIATNSIPAGSDPVPGQHAAAAALRLCGREIDDFCDTLDAFPATAAAAAAELGRIAAGGGGDAADAKAAADLLRDRPDRIARFVEVYLKPLRAHGLGERANAIEGLAKDKLLERREEAVALLRRMREHAVESPLGKLYGRNPFDQGAPAVQLRMALLRAEKILNTQIKPV